MSEETNKENGKTLPYVSFTTFNTAITSIAEHGVPPTIDRSVLQTFSGANQGLILKAFQHLGLTDQHDRPTERFVRYHAGSPEERQNVLQELLKESYPDQIAVIEHGTYQQLKDTFNPSVVQPSVKSKCMSFFMGAAKASGFIISPYIEQGMKARKPRKNAAPKKKATPDPVGPQKSTKGPTDDVRPKGMVQVPIPLGPTKTWFITLDEKPDPGEVKRFLQIAELTFGIE